MSSFDSQLTSDFLYLLEMCRKPELVFSKNSDEYILAKAWMNRLCTYVCHDTNDRRIKNLYLSHLCAALIEQKLRGPFTKLPPLQKLERVDFTVEGKIDAHSPPKGNCANKSEKRSCSVYQSSNYSSCCSPNQNQSCSVNSDNSCAPPEQPQCSAPTCGQANNSSQVAQLPAPPCSSNGYDNALSVCCDSINASRSEGGNEGSVSCSTLPIQTSAGSFEQNMIHSTTPESINNVDIHTCKRSEGGSECHSIEDDFINKFLAHELNFTPEFIKEFEATLSTFMRLCKLMFSENKSQPFIPTRAWKQFKDIQVPIEKNIKSVDIYGKYPENFQLYSEITSPQVESLEATNYHELSMNKNNTTLHQQTTEILLKAKKKLASQVLFQMDEVEQQPKELINVPKTPYPSRSSLQERDDETFCVEFSEIQTPIEISHFEEKTIIPPLQLDDSNSEHILLPESNTQVVQSQDQYNTEDNCNTVELRRDITVLLKLISSELRGESEPGCSDYLEHELSRYSAFLQNYSKMAQYINKLQCGLKLRNFLLLNLQNDLIKFLSE